MKNPFKALTDRFKSSAQPTALIPASKDEWEQFVADTLNESSIITEALVSVSPVYFRFRCPACDRGLRLPDAALGKRFVCAFCSSIYRIELEQDAPVEQPAVTTPELAPAGKSWLPKFSRVASVADKLNADARVQSAKSAIYSATSKITALGKPLAGIAAGTASILLPGAGEVIAGRQKWGFCTMAAFFGVTAAATATGGAWIALPIAIQVFSAHRAVAHSHEAVDTIDSRLRANAEEARQVAEELAAQAQRLNDEQFEAEMRRREVAELEASTGQRLVKIKLWPLGKKTQA